jgi:SAM-dependent methyltransferase
MDKELPSCGCGSNVRKRALIHLLSMELFGQSLILPEFPKLKAIRGAGMTDDECYAKALAEKFDYTNTYYDREPRLDFTEAHPSLSGTYDFILSADVLEHIAPPLDRALGEVCRLLKPNGFFVATVPCPSHETLEHFPELHQYRIVPLGDTAVLINRRRDGSLEITDELLFHGGPGATLEMRQLSSGELREKLLASGFRGVEFLNQDLPEIGVFFDLDVSQPLVARKEKFAMSGSALSQIIDSWHSAQTQVSLASASKWVRLGRLLGIGPRFS